ncbi:sugar ABC transporter substrate-binding protein [Ligilactobacillus equi]|uniref:ABC transporter substrate-binding protein n=1 Tax=Ligilactobacillus equi TaxID=137357 RepID=UPI002ED690DD
MKFSKLGKIAAVGAVALAMLTVGGCSSSKGASSSSKDITMWVHVSKDDPEGKALQKNVNEFNKENKEGYKAKVQYIPRSGSGGGYEDKINAALNSGTLPDVMTLDGPNTAAYAKAGIIQPIDKYITNKDDFLKSIITQGTYDKKLYAIGYSESSVGVYYNKKMFAEAGITNVPTIDNPWTYTQFEEACQKLKDKFGEKAAFNMNLNDHSEWALYAFAPFIWSSGGSITNPAGTKAVGYFNDKGSQEGFQFIQDMVKNGYAPISPKDKGFQTGKYAMQLSGTWTVQELDTKYKDLEYGVMPYPVSPTTHKLVSPTGSWQYAMSSNAKNKKAAGALVNYLVSKKAMYRSDMANTVLPARKSVSKMMEPKLTEPMKVLLTQNQKTGHARPVLVNYPQVTRSFAETVTDVTYYKKNPDLKKLLTKQAKTIQGYLSGKSTN